MRMDQAPGNNPDFVLGMKHLFDRELMKKSVFRGFAEDLGLDMAAFDAAVADPATEERIKLDVADGEALGVAGTPTFYLDGEVLNPESLEAFRAAVETAATD